MDQNNVFAYVFINKNNFFTMKLITQMACQYVFLIRIFLFLEIRDFISELMTCYYLDHLL